METILVKATNSDDYESDVDAGTLPGQLSVLLAMLKISCFDNPVDNILVTSILVANILVTSILVTIIFVTSILVTSMLVTNILVTNILVTKVPEPEKKGLTHYASKIKYYTFGTALKTNYYTPNYA